MIAVTRTFFWLALAAPSPALAQVAPSQSAPRFGGLWTGWAGANRSSLEAEANADAAAAAAPEQHRTRSEGRALGERVGEIVRLGDCDEGERVARAAGDFALVDAVRDHCRSSRAPSAPVPAAAPPDQ